MSQTSIELIRTPIVTETRSERQHDAEVVDAPRSVEAEPEYLRKGTTIIIFTSITAVTGISSLLSGLVTVALPTIARDLDLPPSLLLWQVTFVEHFPDAAELTRFT